MPWTTNAIMEWSLDGGTTWTRISDHGRSELSVSWERIENKRRMADGTLRRYVVGKKRTWTTSWEHFPDKATTFLANGQPGQWMENFHNAVDGTFHMRIRAGSDMDKSLTGMTGNVYEVMITDFSKTIVKRGQSFDLWSLDITLEEV